MASAQVVLIREGIGNAQDRRFYSRAVLQRAVDRGLFSDVPSFFDHAPPGTPPEKRRRAGTIREPSVQTIEGRAAVIATLHANPAEPKAAALIQTAAEYSKKYPDRSLLGLSISGQALGDGTMTLREGETAIKVSEIRSVESVDLVCRPGAGGGLFSGQLLTLRESERIRTTTFAPPKQSPTIVPFDRASRPANPEPRIAFWFDDTDDDEPIRATAPLIGELREAAPRFTAGFAPTFDFDTDARPAMLWPADPIRRT